MVFLKVSCFFAAINLVVAEYPFQACKKGDYKCMTDQGKKTLNSILKGDKAYNIPDLTPLLLQNVDLDGSNIKLKLKNLKIFGIENLEIREIKLDTDKKSGTVNIFIPNFKMVGDYEMNGKILILNLNGKGATNITLVDGTGKWDFTYETYKKDGEEFAKIKDSKYERGLKRATMYFENLFQGNPELTKSTNEVLNSEWQTVVDTFGDGFVEIIKTILELVLGNYMKAIPINKFVINS
ncbi:unnamed protein product [Brassicogethes aeneus]|uniref:Uncharacterized protein n=1 Tax=Brassicogethes aeneus TaxID=1431903 RepID=A0A9P0B0Q8_BRAAE|nr:unnamed protein product [Brassicogethes aeneus]